MTRAQLETAWQTAYNAACDAGHHGGLGVKFVARTNPALYAQAVAAGVIDPIAGPPGAATTAPRPAPTPQAVAPPATRPVPAAAPFVPITSPRPAMHPTAPASPAPSATAQWKAALAAQHAKGLTGTKALIAADRARPGLREQMLAETNAPAPSPPPTAKGLAGAKWRAAVESEVAALVARRIPAAKARVQAMANVDRTHPGLREQMIAEDNQR